MAGGAGAAVRVLSGVQPTGRKHLGNWFGAIRQHLELAAAHPGQCFYFIADYHALTTVGDGAALRASVLELARTYLALGLDPAQAALFRQSDVPAVTELMWLLGTVANLGLLERAHAWKDRLRSGQRPRLGLFAYPVLMAADILAHDATLVPVGRDQIQHVEIAQDLATAFNERFGRGSTLLRRPEWLLSAAPWVAGTDGRKMSTSHGNTIPILAHGDELRRLIGGIVTASVPLGAPMDPGRCNVFALLRLFACDAERERIAGWYRAGAREGRPFGFADAKRLLAARIEATFAEARARHDALLREPERVDECLRAGAARARPVAARTLERCRRACGLG